MSLTRWLGETALAHFIEHYYLRLPFSRSDDGKRDQALGSWDTLGRILGGADADAMIVRDNQRVEAEPPRDRRQAQELTDQGCTILVRNAQRHDPDLAELAAGFERDFRGPVNIHIYATPPGRFGFGWHYDAEEVFILQTLGEKEYALRKNTVNPWPLEETLPDDMHYEREVMPLMRCSLKAGDWLYIPGGYWHKAEAREMSISLAVGVMAPAAVQVLDRLRGELLESLFWRQRLPLPTDDNPEKMNQWREQYRILLDQLADDLQKRLKAPTFLDQLLQ